MGWLLALLAGLGGGILLVVLLLEWRYRQHASQTLQLSVGKWQTEDLGDRLKLVGHLELSNPSRRYEFMVPELTASTRLLAKQSLASLRWRTTVTPEHKDVPARPDGYWFAYIVETAQSTRLRIEVEIEGADRRDLEAAWIRADYISYGPTGRWPRTQHIILPLRYPDPFAELPWRSSSVAAIRPILTHLLTSLDDPAEVVRKYVLPHSQPGDILTIGETPVAIMQGRWRHPSEIRPGWVARRICQFFLPTSSLATACGMQSLVDIVGPARVLYAFFGGILLRLLGQHGGFYQLAGEQARLVDDVTGTLPPYDQFIVLGPSDPLAVASQIEAQTGLPCAIVDVNDLKAVKVLAASPGVAARVNPLGYASAEAFLTAALRDNPAGNSDEQTPLVLLRPQAKS
jgi:hypothetical protein